MKIKIISLLVFGIILSAGLSSAILCDIASIQQTWIQGETPSPVTLVCSVPINNSAIISSIGSHFSTSPSMPFTITSGNSQSFIINFDSATPLGNSQGLIYFNDSTAPIVINITVKPAVANTCQINPSLISYAQSVQQGTKIPLPKITFNPVNCNGDLILTASTVSIQGGIITNEGIQKPVSISSIVSDGINLNIDTNGLNSQTYSSVLNIQAFGKSFQIPFTITVTLGTTPISNFSVSNLPTCSVTSTTMNLNKSYSLVCTNLIPDVTIVPEIDNAYIVGYGLDTSQNQFIWYFSPVKFGNTFIKAKFFYRGVPVGTQYSQEVKITSSGSSVAGTSLAFLFTPNMTIAKSGENVIIQLIDNKTGSLVDNPEVYINAVQLTNISTSFNFSFKQDVTYSIRGRAVGYDDIVQDIKLLAKPLYIGINPSSGDSATLFAINSSDNATLYLDGSIISNPSTITLSAGNHSIVALKEGFIEAQQNITIESSPTAILTSEFKKGIKQKIILTKNMSWELRYQKDLSSEEKVLLSGTSDSVEFTPSNSGIYKITSGDKVLGTFEIKGWDWKILYIKWYWWLTALGAVILIIWIRKSNSSNEIPIVGRTNIPIG